MADSQEDFRPAVPYRVQTDIARCGIVFMGFFFECDDSVCGLAEDSADLFFPHGLVKGLCGCRGKKIRIRSRKDPGGIFFRIRIHSRKDPAGIFAGIRS